ncbi:MAG TPA: nucleoside kinase [Anaerolineae bacterium]|nr:nucleoside kinase [Anaerolineae bacterium]
MTQAEEIEQAFSDAARDVAKRSPEGSSNGSQAEAPREVRAGVPGSVLEQIHPAEPRDTAQVWLDDGRVFEGPVGTPLEAFIQVAGSDPAAPTVAALIDNELRELTYRVESDVEVKPVTMADSDGFRIYRRSLAFLLVTAAHDLFPEATVYVDHSLTFGGYFCEVQGRAPFSPSELARIETRMRDIVAADEPIWKSRVPLSEAIALFQARGDHDKVRLLTNRRKEYLTLYSLRGFADYFHGYMVPSTGYLTTFGLQDYPPGFILRFPRTSPPMELQPFVDYPKLVSVFREYGEWMELMGVRDVGLLNEAIAGARVREVVLVAEALHEQRVARVAEEIAARRGQVRVVLIAGPSSSGKTTFSKRLGIQLLANGMRPFALEMDNYFVDRLKTPRAANGDYDFESLYALDVALFNEHLLHLLEGREVRLPRYNFRTGLREVGDVVDLDGDHIVIVEGIHGLNPSLVAALPANSVYRVYVSALTQLNIDKHNRVPTTDTRLLRRIVRDAAHRGYTAQQTVDRWQSVRGGEKEWIFPFQENADIMFNSALVYELSVLKPLAEPLLLQIKPRTPAYVEAKRLLSLLEWFHPLAPDLVPDNSILREFVGGSILRDFRLG